MEHPIEKEAKSVGDYVQMKIKEVFDNYPAHELANKIAGVIPADEFRYPANIDYDWAFGYENGFRVNVDLKPEQTFKAVEEYLEVAIADGWEAQKVKDDSAKNRMFPFTKGRAKFAIHVRGSDRCKLVQVGMKPVYEMRCDDEPAAVPVNPDVLPNDDDTAGSSEGPIF